MKGSGREEEGGHPDVFLRESTGLVKNVSLLDAIALNINNMSAGAALATIGFTTVLLPAAFMGANLVLGSALAFILTLPQVIVYVTMSRRIPRTGGDYVWVSRTFGGAIGGPLAFMGYTMEVIAYMALIALSAVSAIGSVGSALGFDASWAAAPLPQFVVAAAIFAALIAVNMFSPRAGYKLVSAAMAIGVATLLLGIGAVLAAGHSGVVGYADSLASRAGDPSLAYASMAGSYRQPSTWAMLRATLLLLPFFAIFVYPWINAGPAVASELRGSTALRWNIPIAMSVTFALVTGAFAAMYYAGGVPFVNAALVNPTYVGSAGFSFWGLAMGVASAPVLQWAIGIGWITWYVAILAYAIIVISRYLFAQAFDRFLPTKVADVHGRFASPYVALIVELVLTVFLIGAAAFSYGTFVSLYGAVVGAMAYFLAVGAAAAVYGYRRERGSSRWALMAAGSMQAAVFAALIYLFLAYPGVWGGNPLAYGWEVGAFAVGVAMYQWSRRRHRRMGIDVDGIYREIPPD